MRSYALSLLQKSIALNVKINIHFNYSESVNLLNNIYTQQYNKAAKVLVDNDKLKIPQHLIFFFNFLKKVLNLKKIMLIKYRAKNLDYLIKKYYFFFKFIKYYLLHLFDALKYIFFIKCNIPHFMFKLKFIMFLMYYKSFVHFVHFKRRKKAFKAIVPLKKTIYKHSNKIFVYNTIIKTLKFKNKKESFLSIQDPVLDTLKIEEEPFRQPFFSFKYKPSLNIKKKNRYLFYRNKKNLKYKKKFKYFKLRFKFKSKQLANVLKAKAALVKPKHFDNQTHGLYKQPKRVKATIKRVSNAYHKVLM